MPLPSLEKLFLEVPLYETFEFSKTDAEYIFTVIRYQDTIDGYCPSCQKISTFVGTNTRNSSIVFDNRTISAMAEISMETFLNKIHQVNFECTRNTAHLMQVVFYFTRNSFQKIGQYPSIADLSLQELSKYRKILGNEKHKELIRAVGLITHGVGIGAFVYLRRIFEDLIEETHRKLSSEANWNEEIYQRSRMDEKINLLQNELPRFLVENRKLYSILSKGIHELSENECLEYFSTVRLGIELILEERLRQKIIEEKISQAQKSINQIHTDLLSK